MTRLEPESPAQIFVERDPVAFVFDRARVGVHGHDRLHLGKPPQQIKHGSAAGDAADEERDEEDRVPPGLFRRLPLPQPEQVVLLVVRRTQQTGDRQSGSEVPEELEGR